MDTEQFKQMFLPYHRRLYQIAYRLLEDEQDAEDLLQEAYLKLWDKREELALISHPEAFCVTMVKHMCFDLMRSGSYLRDRQRIRLGEVGDVPAADDDRWKDDAEVVRQIMARLPEQQQTVVTLRDVKGCSYDEIERLMGLNSTYVRVLLSRARKKIREEFIKWNDI